MVAHHPLQLIDLARCAAVVGAAALLGGLASPVQAQARGAGGVTATIVPPMSVGGDPQLQFGSIRSSGQPGVVTVSETGARRANGGVALVGDQVSTAATISIQEDGSTAYTIDTPSEVAVGPMKVSTRLSEVRSTSGRKIMIGAVLKVPPGTPPAVYRAVFPVTAVFN